jgi:hypothetical protein
MNHFMTHRVAIALLLATACSRSEPATVAAASPTEGAPASSPTEGAAASSPAPVLPTVAPSANRLQPFLTSGGVSFMVPKRGWWVNFNTVCLREMERASPSGVTALQMAEASMPQLFAALRAQDVELRDDLQAMGAYRCGDEVCMYGVLRLPHPDRLHEVLNGIPGFTAKKKIDAAHYVVTTALPTGGERRVHLRWVPLDWSAVSAASTKASLADAQRKATHLVLLYGVNPGQPEPDPFADLASPVDAAAKVAAVEKLAAPPTDRCLVGEAGELDERGLSDMRLRGAQFVVAAPPRGDRDAAARALGYDRSLDIEVVLTVEGKPTQADAARWVEAGKLWVSSSLGPATSMLEGAFGGKLGDARALLEAAFTYRVEGNRVHMSLGTRNIPESAIAGLGARL